jgi:hypothetical protein
MGCPKRMDDGVMASAAKLDWSLIDQNAKLLHWYESGCFGDMSHFEQKGLPARNDGQLSFTQVSRRLGDRNDDA